ncbi:uncharacterized protein EI90DRAFT_3279271 [Cantharellus anzutake]|uniref:uncharacterized protein n=1 Tax=Cantharellus anzutake TaxID=1750568 RepID=UPI0019064751|nr:uncharacterized protein EI90DRAFT_3279271 [Cantharellus anzutake]KAF8339680.1 hypothetical protein EI90DRAFT_3279271 [Cantharellus anzutake]
MAKEYRRVLLSSIKSLTLFSDEYTLARRASPIPQLTCIGQVCDVFQPEAIQCFNIGGTGTDVKWKCEADLPSSLRFGKVSVSCEGWSGPGDMHVLEGSCGLEYRLLHVPQQFRPPNWDGSSYLSTLNRWFNTTKVTTIIFDIVWTSGGWLSGWFGGNTPRPPPPPYAPSDPFASKSESSWTPGFWTGLGLGGLAASIWNSNRAAEDSRLRQQQHLQREYDWERARMAASTGGSGYGWSTPSPAPRRRAHADECLDSEGAGPSGLGSTRRSTGLGGSVVR